jgi:hypothetical protein
MVVVVMVVVVMVVVVMGSGGCVGRCRVCGDGWWWWLKIKCQRLISGGKLNMVT